MAAVRVYRPDVLLHGLLAAGLPSHDGQVDFDTTLVEFLPHANPVPAVYQKPVVHLDGLKFAATCVRVPVALSHAEAVHVEFEGPAPIEALKAALRVMPGVVLIEDPTQVITPLQAANRDEAFVARLRIDPTVDHGVVFWCVTDNLRKGAATNAIQIAEELLRRNLVRLPALKR